MKVHHIGYLVKRLDKAIEKFEKLGFRATGEIIKDPLRLVDLCFLKNGECVVELVSPINENSVVFNLAKSFHNAPYHICYESNDFLNDIEILEQSGFVKIEQPQPAIAFNNKKVVFLLNQHIGIIEILEI